MSRNQAVSWWRYNPILQKPRGLDPVRPWSWFWYMGPDPAAGVSYGQYHDPKTKFDIVTEKPEGEHIVYSPATQEPMEFISDVSYAELSDLLSKSTSQMNHKANCEGCAVDLISDFDLSLPDKVFCPKCGGDVQIIKDGSGDGKAVSAENKSQEKTMSASEARIKSLKTRIRANILKKRKVEAAKVQAKATKPKTRPSLRRVKADDEMISLDTIMEAMDKEMENEEEEALMKEGEEVAEEEEVEMDSYMEEEGEEVAEEEPMEEESEMYMEEEPMEEEAEEEALLELEIEENAEEGEDEEGGEEDDYMDLDMVISMINKKEKIAKAKRQVKQAKQAKLKALAAKKKKIADIRRKKKIKANEGEEEEEVEEDEALMDEEEAPNEEDIAEGADEGEEAGKPDETPDSSNDEVNEDEDTGENKPEPDMVSEENSIPDEESEATEAMKFEPLASVANLDAIKKEEIDMALYGEESDNPTWNVTVAGIPTARIQLKKQMAPEEIRSAFCSDDYAKDLIVHCERTGFVKTMQNVRAEFWSNYTSDAKVAARYKSDAEKAFSGERKKLVAGFRDSFRNCLNIVSAGLSKNFYPELGNALKDSLFTNLKTVGLPENTAVSAIEKSFQESAGEYFNALFNKAESYLDMSPQARQEISAAISNGSSLNHYNSEGLDKAPPANLGDRVAQASVIPESSGNQGAFKVNSGLVMDTENYKAQLKSVFRKR